MIGFEAATAGLNHSSYIFGWPLWANWLFFFVWAWVIILMTRWSWKFSYVRLHGKGIIPDAIASSVAASTMFLIRPWVGYAHSSAIFMMAFCATLLVYSIAAQYYYKRIVLGIRDWDRVHEDE